jgi:hypothetical protein
MDKWTKYKNDKGQQEPHKQISQRHPEPIHAHSTNADGR